MVEEGLTMGVIDRTQAVYDGLSRLRQYARYVIGRVTGSVASTDGKYKFFLEHAESRHFHRVELNALIVLLTEKKIIAEGEWEKYLLKEIEIYEESLKQQYPEVTVPSDGRSVIVHTEGAYQRTKQEKWPP